VHNRHFLYRIPFSCHRKNVFWHCYFIIIISCSVYIYIHTIPALAVSLSSIAQTSTCIILITPHKCCQELKTQHKTALRCTTEIFNIQPFRVTNIRHRLRSGFPHYKQRVTSAIQDPTTGVPKWQFCLACNYCNYASLHLSFTLKLHTTPEHSSTLS
jgi:hypothetical protein